MTTSTQTPTAAAVSEAAVQRFLFLEARLQDEHRYDEWEALLSDDALYWVPAGDDDLDPATRVSFIYDNRSRIASRIRQLKTGRRYAQSPPSRMRRIVGNIEIESVSDEGIRVGSNFQLIEYRHGQYHQWAGRTVHLLRAEGESFRIAMKKVLLIDNDGPIDTLAFLI
ncbi:MAG: aromatic-ring-hydroxylating dioxygenase subunit beta [Burkholderiaceae bacterium]|nr:aromatic-ring-hydroxylating dioxygenase subunit beta [Burkholderiaceae bacterium]